MGTNCEWYAQRDAYEMGYEAGWRRHSSRPFPEEVCRLDALYEGWNVLMWFKAGFADGHWDDKQGNPFHTSYEPP